MLDLRTQMTINYVNVLNAAVETLGVSLTERYYNKDIELFLALFIANNETVDYNNNVGRLCSISGDKTSRENRVIMSIQNGYVLLNLKTNEIRLGSIMGCGPYLRMGNLY